MPLTFGELNNNKLHTIRKSSKCEQWTEKTNWKKHQENASRASPTQKAVRTPGRDERNLTKQNN